MATVPGYAMRRNGSCLSTETDCGETSTPFHACCPGNMFCPGPQLNVVCCGSNAQCSQKIDDNCANSRANLYSTSSNLTTDAFCCAQDKYAFAFEDGGAGCADQLSDLVYGQTELRVLSTASATPTPSSTHFSSTILSTSTSSAISSSSPTSTSEPEPASSNNTGAIAGGVVGGVGGVAIVAVLFWLFLRRRRKLTPGEKPTDVSLQSGNLSQSVISSKFSRTEYQGYPQELGIRRETQPAELSGGPGG